MKVLCTSLFALALASQSAHGLIGMNITRIEYKNYDVSSTTTVLNPGAGTFNFGRPTQDVVIGSSTVRRSETLSSTILWDSTYVEGRSSAVLDFSLLAGPVPPGTGSIVNTMRTVMIFDVTAPASYLLTYDQLTNAQSGAGGPAFIAGGILMNGSGTTLRTFNFSSQDSSDVISLPAGTFYRIEVFASAVLNSSGGQYPIGRSEFSSMIRLGPVPAPGTAAVVFFGVLAGCRRRR